MHPMLDQILRTWAIEFGSEELTVKTLVSRASKPLREMFLRVASDPQDRHTIHPRLLGVFFGENRGIAAAGWQLQDRSVCRQSAWHLEPAPFEKEKTVPAPVPTAMFDRTPDLFGSTPAEKLGVTLDRALGVNDAILAVPVDIENLKQTRLQAEVASTTLYIATKVDQNQLQREDARMKNLDRLVAHMREMFEDDAGARAQDRSVRMLEGGGDS
jgi:hypothetical protein